MAPRLRQTAGNAVASGQSISCTATLDRNTVQGNLVVVVASATHPPGYYPLFGPSGFTLARARTEDELTVAVWYRADCPPISRTSVITTAGKSLQVRVLEYEGLAQSNVLDKVSIDGDNDESGPGSRFPDSGSSGTTSQADELVLGVIANRYVATQSGFSGGMSKLVETTSPERWGSSNYESERWRTRLTVHETVAASTGSFRIKGQLSTIRDWVAVVLTFRGGTTGPARMSSLTGPAVLTTRGRGDLTVFGPLVATQTTQVLSTGGSGRIGPFEWQFRLGGWDGLLIGHGTDYEVVSISGLGGAEVRTSDTDFSRGDGSFRGADFQTARQMQFTVNFFDDPATMEQRMARLMKALVPRRDADWDLLFRLPGQPLQVLRCRPIQLVREMDLIQSLYNTQSFALRAADPRIYSARQQIIDIPVSPAGSIVNLVSAVNAGNARAYPVIRIANRGTVDVTRIELVNVTADIAFNIVATIPPNSQLVGDMPARITAAPRSVVQVDGQSRYGSWQPPREPFHLAPDPDTRDGVNALYLRTTPAGANVTATIEYRDTWAG